MSQREILLGNEAIAHGLLEAGCTLAASYPGTPASEIMGALIQLKKQHGLSCHLEWSINEKVAFEVALANSYAGRRSAVSMKQVGLNVAADPFLSAVYTGVKGGLLVIAADDPGPHSSQTEQDSRLFAHFAKAPVLDPSSPEEARNWIGAAFELSERYEIPVVLRPTTRICHGRQDLEMRPLVEVASAPFFEKDPARWAATPKFRYRLHQELNRKIAAIADDEAFAPKLLNRDALEGRERAGGTGRDCLVASGVALAHATEILQDLGLWNRLPCYQVLMPYPLSHRFRNELSQTCDRVLVLEETEPVIELQLQNREKVLGRTNGTVPSAGELLPETIEAILRDFAGLPQIGGVQGSVGAGRRPTLCAGCPHRAAFFAIKKAFPRGIYPGDIGCYTLGLNLGAVDTVLCMGAAVSMAAGFYHAYRNVGEKPRPIAATVGDSTFFHAGIPALVNAVVQDARFVLVVLDNSTTAMTGHQPTPAAGRTLDGKPVPAVSIEELARACGVRHVTVGDPYRFDHFVELLKDAGAHTQGDQGGVAVVIARRPCLMDRSHPQDWERRSVIVNEKCEGCAFCIKHFECPALEFQDEDQPIRINAGLCSGCGVCVHVCPHGALQVEPRK